MNVTDLVYIDSTGYNFKDYPSFFNWLTAQYQAVYGADVYLGSDSQDGQWLAIVAQALYDTAAVGSKNYNSFSPATAQGIGLSRVVKINGVDRLIPTSSQVALVIIGIAGTPLVNAIAIDTLQQKWLIPTTTIPLSGTITITATAADPGAVNALPNTITGIFTPTQGWQSINNPAAATPGNPAETDAALRIRQTQSVALPAQTVFEATIGAVENVPGVTKTKGYENDTGTTDGNGIPAHSISIVVVGGNVNAIAAAIQENKTPGTRTFGTTSISTTDSRGMPLVINFYIATSATIAAQVTITHLAGWESSTNALIQAAVAAAIAAYGIGSTIVLTQLYAAAYLYGTPQAGSFIVDTIELSKNGGGFFANNVVLGFNENPVCNPSTDVTIIP